jgi:outer membrane murein-binding lipoprotein Lpp
MLYLIFKGENKMKKFLTVILFAFAAVGCASKSDLAAVQTQVDSLSADVSTLKTEVEGVKSNQEALKADLDSLNGKLDRLFVKQAKK